MKRTIIKFHRQPGNVTWHYLAGAVKSDMLAIGQNFARIPTIFRIQSNMHCQALLWSSNALVLLYIIVIGLSTARQRFP
jgi:hypothetical protein